MGRFYKHLTEIFSDCDIFVVPIYLDNFHFKYTTKINQNNNFENAK